MSSESLGGEQDRARVIERSGFVALVGRPNAGKSTLVNQLVGTKVSIVSDKPQTTRHRVIGVLTRPPVQLVLVDLPGLHKPVTPLGEHLNATVDASLGDVDAVCVVVDATAPVGRGDRWVLERTPPEAVVVLNKVDRARPERIASQLEALARFDKSAYFAVSARTGDGVDALVEHLAGLVPEGPGWYPDGQISDLAEPRFVAELVREQLLGVLREELPHSIHTRVTEWDWPRIEVEILVERESQKGIVIGRGGSVLKRVGIRVRRQLAEGAHLTLKVKVEPNWQHRAEMVERLLGAEEL